MPPPRSATVSQLRSLLWDALNAKGGAATALLSVATGAELADVQDAQLALGSLAYTDSYGGAYWALSPTQPAIPGSVITAKDGRSWTRFASAQPEFWLAQETWGIDFAHGDDEGPGTLVSPVKTFAEIFRRYASNRPELSSRITYQQLTSSPLSDAIDFEPTLVGGGGFLIQGTLVPLGSPLTIGTYTPKNKSAGTLDIIHVAGQTWIPGTIVHDLTASATFAIQADLGSGSASITNPIQNPIDFTPVPVTIASGDTLHLFTPTDLPIAKLGARCIGNGSGQGAQVRNVNVTADLLALLGSQVALTESTQRGCILETYRNGDAQGPVLTSVWQQDFFGGGAMTGIAIVWASAQNGAGNFWRDGTILDFDTIVPLRGHIEQQLNIGTAYLGQWPENTVYEQCFAVVVIQAADAGVACVWGPHRVNPTACEQVLCRGADATTVFLGTGGMTINNLSNAWAFDPTATPPAFTAAMAINATNVKANGSLMNPATGARICQSKENG